MLAYTPLKYTCFTYLLVRNLLVAIHECVWFILYIPLFYLYILVLLRRNIWGVWWRGTKRVDFTAGFYSRSTSSPGALFTKSMVLMCVYEIPSTGDGLRFNMEDWGLRVGLIDGIRGWTGLNERRRVVESGGVYWS